jgi:DNA-binding transcriptional ArsR family regulator
MILAKNLMPTYQNQAQLFKVLMHPTRLAILDVLRSGEQCVCHMEATLGLHQAHISQHLMVLRNSGLITDRRDGWNVFYRVSKQEIYQVVDAMNRVSGVQNGESLAVNQARQKPCPCPKCNTGKDAARYDLPGQALNAIESES